VTYESRFDGSVPVFDTLMSHLARHADDLRVQADTVGVWMGSGNTGPGVAAAFDPSRRRIRAAVIYYGSGEAPAVRRDLPTLVVRVGLDQPAVLRAQDAMIARMLAANLPVSVINHPHGTHPFEEPATDSASANVVRQTLAFLTTALSVPAARSYAAGEPLAAAAAALLAQQWDTAVARYQAIVRQQPSDFDLVQRLGDALLGAGRFLDAAEQYERALELGSWRRGELAFGAIASYAQAGQLERARPWLGRIPPRWTTEFILSRLGPAASAPGVVEFVRSRNNEKK
jgi:hypothetical protein